MSTFLHAAWSVLLVVIYVGVLLFIFAMLTWRFVEAWRRMRAPEPPPKVAHLPNPVASKQAVGLTSHAALLFGWGGAGGSGNGDARPTRVSVPDDEMRSSLRVLSYDSVHKWTPPPPAGVVFSMDAVGPSGRTHRLHSHGEPELRAEQQQGPVVPDAVALRVLCVAILYRGGTAVEALAKIRAMQGGGMVTAEYLEQAKQELTKAALRRIP